MGLEIIKMINNKKAFLKTFLGLFVAIFLTFTNSIASAESKTTFYHYDLLGSPVATTNQAGAVLWREEYSPWGEKLLKQDADKDNVRGYTGHVNDKETGLTYMQARYYDPEIGRFMGIDPVGFKEGNPIMFNRYAYANNNPFKFVDPNGEIAETVWDVANIGMGVVSLGSNIKEGNWGWAAVDVLGIGIDGIATAVPIVPGGMGAILKSSRVGDNALTGTRSIALKAADNINVLDQLNVDKISNINKQYSDGHLMDRKDISTVIANASYRSGGLQQSASVIRDIAGGHLFSNGNKRTAQALVESFGIKGLSKSNLRDVIDKVGEGSLKEVDDIADELGDALK